MKTTNHTPGSWAIHERAKDSRTHISNGAHIVCTLGTTRTDGSPNHTPNARLISSAPDLLDALDWALRQIEDDLDPDHQAAFDAACSTLAKAKGVIE